MMIVPTYYANIYVGLKEGYNGIQYSIDHLCTLCQTYCNTVKLGLTVTPTKFIYVDGSEMGAIVGRINYPRFPSTNEMLRSKAVDLAILLKDEFKQQRLSIVCPDETIMIGEP